MLVLTFNEPIYLNTTDGVIVIRQGNNGKISIAAPPNVVVVRESVMQRNAETEPA